MWRHTCNYTLPVTSSCRREDLIQMSAGIKFNNKLDAGDEMREGEEERRREEER